MTDFLMTLSILVIISNDIQVTSNIIYENNVAY